MVKKGLEFGLGMTFLISPQQCAFVPLFGKQTIALDAGPQVLIVDVAGPVETNTVPINTLGS